jgi:hypothetical protein
VSLLFDSGTNVTLLPTDAEWSLELTTVPGEQSDRYIYPVAKMGAIEVDVPSCRQR